MLAFVAMSGAKAVNRTTSARIFIGGREIHEEWLRLCNECRVSQKKKPYADNYRFQYNIGLVLKKLCIELDEWNNALRKAKKIHGKKVVLNVAKLHDLQSGASTEKKIKICENIMRLSSVPNTTKTSTETKSRNAKRQSLWPYVCALYRCGMISQKAISHEQLLSDHVLDTTMQIAEEIYLVGKLVCLTTIAFFSLQFLNFLTTNFLTTKIYVFFSHNNFLTTKNSLLNLTTKNSLPTFKISLHF